MINKPATVQHQEIRHKELVRHLFVDGGLNAYAVLDGASNPALLDHLYDGVRPEFACRADASTRMRKRKGVRRGVGRAGKKGE